MADLIRRKQAGEAWETAVDTGGSVGSRVIGPFVFSYDVPALNEGIPSGIIVAAGEILLDAWFEVLTAFNGESRFGNVGELPDGEFFLANTCDFQSADAPLRSFSYNQNKTALSVQSGYQGARYVPIRNTSSDPVELAVCVSQDGLFGGTAVGGSDGIAALYVHIAQVTPVS